ncbi:MAG: glycerol-3-phosphate dehydrogenase [Steroidobacteraceae bacterium]
MAVEGAFDLLIVGGGINGAGIARDAAGRGLRVLLVEQGSLAQHTSSASTKLVHGGLRYLEYFQFRLVHEALAERERLLAIAPHLVHRKRFVLPYDQRQRLRPAWMVRLGLFFYDHLALGNSLERSANVRFATSPLGQPLRSTLRRGFAYSDCTVDDSRLVILNAKDAAERGAQVRVGHRLVRAAREGDVWKVLIEDRASQQASVIARALVNAAGPWVAEVLAQRLDCRSRQAVRLIKGSHIVVRRIYEGDHAYVLQHADRRIVFVVPYQNDFTLIGTTDVPWPGDPGPMSIDPVEVEYLCQTVNGYFERQIGPGDVVWSYAGIRPLWDDAASDAAAVTRDYVLDVEAARGAPVLSVFGGKITTYRRLAEHALGKLEPHLGPLGKPWTGKVPLPGGDIPGADVPAFIDEVRRRWPFLDAVQAQRLAHAYGTRISRLLAGVDSRQSMGEDFGGGLTKLEVDFLVREEWAASAEDIYWRHTKAGLHASAADERRLSAYLQSIGQDVGLGRAARAG